VVFFKLIPDFLFYVRVESCMGNWLGFNRIKGLVIAYPCSKLAVGTYTAFTPSMAFTSIPVRPDCRPCS